MAEAFPGQKVSLSLPSNRGQMHGVVTGVSPVPLPRCSPVQPGGGMPGSPGQHSWTEGASSVCIVGPSQLLCEVRGNSTAVYINSILLKRSIALSALRWAFCALDGE